jgi:hypothetical protein
MPLSGNDHPPLLKLPEGIFRDIDPPRADGNMLEQLALLLAGHLVLQRERADCRIAGVVIAALRYLGG